MRACSGGHHGHQSPRAKPLTQAIWRITTTLFLLLLAPTAKKPADVPPGRLAAVDEPPADLFAARGERVHHGAGRPPYVAAVLVLALPLGAVDPFLGEGVAHGLEQPALAELAGREVVHAVLELVDRLDARDFGLGEGVCR